MKYYIASGLENAERVRELKKILDASGWEHTYDWTVHGSVQQDGPERLAEVADAETRGVIEADVVITLLPGGRGTHVELGMAVGELKLAYMLQAVGIGEVVGRRIIVFSETPGVDFDGWAGKTCAFYHHPYVERFSSMETMLVSLGVAR